MTPAAILMRVGALPLVLGAGIAGCTAPGGVQKKDGGLGGAGGEAGGGGSGANDGPGRDGHRGGSGGGSDPGGMGDAMGGSGGGGMGGAGGAADRTCADYGECLDKNHCTSKACTDMCAMLLTDEGFNNYNALVACMQTECCNTPSAMCGMMGTDKDGYPICGPATVTCRKACCDCTFASYCGGAVKANGPPDPAKARCATAMATCYGIAVPALECPLDSMCKDTCSGP